ncbi:MAG: glycosyltransferase family 2 protein [Thermoleophilia bacterium]|nr:glycosyltransferase family 2 protein [Thermoleophilia bacterium]
MSDPLDVTVVIPTRDRWALLSETLEAVLRQQGVSFDVVVVDDGSADETRAKVAGLGDGRVRVVRHERSLGVARARNAGIAAARGEWIAFLDDDDLWSPHKLRRQLDAASPSSVFAYAAVAVLDESGRVARYAPAPDPRTLRRRLLERPMIPAGGSNVVARTAVVHELGGFDENLAQLADWDLWIRLAGAGTAAACPDVLVGYRKHATNMLLTDPRDVLQEFAYLVRKHDAPAREHGVRFSDAAMARWVAVGYRRAGRRRRAAALYLSAARDERRPADLARAGAALAGSWTMRIGRRSASPPPAWLKPYLEARR